MGQRDGRPGISAREAQVLAGVAEHLTNAEIAARLVLSVRTVESHVSSLLRKLGASDRRALLAHAALVSHPRFGDRPRPSWPAPLTAFIGRATERGDLADALSSHRLVTAVGPGGIGKTRLAQTVATDVIDRYADGGC
jgi:DNA-binding CsgD family transcriptional regulator